MSVDINLRILDRFRYVERMLRTAGPACMDETTEHNGGNAKYSVQEKTDSAPVNCPSGLLKRDTVLPFLLSSKGGMKQKEIADEIRVSPSTLSEMLNRLVDDGLVERKQDPDDRRAKILCLTDKGSERAEYMLVQITQLLNGLFVNLELDEKEELIRLLDKLVGNDSGDQNSKGISFSEDIET